LYNIGGIGLNSRINVSIKGQTIEFVPLNAGRPNIGFVDYRDIHENDRNKDGVTFPNPLTSYQNLQIKNPLTGRPERSPFYFRYVGALEGGPKSITEDQLLVGNKNRANLDDGETKTYTLYGRMFAVDRSDSIKITSISEDTGKKGDFITNDNTLIFRGTAEPKSKVEVFLDKKSIGIVYANDKGKWFHDYSQVKLPNGKYELTAEETNFFGEVETTIPQPLEIDKIISISEDTGIKGDFITGDNTLIFNGTAEPKSKVEVFLERNSIGIVYANNKGKWSHDYSQVKLPDGKYELTAEETNLLGEVETIQQPLEIDTDYNIDLDFTDTSIANKQSLQDQIKKAADYWEGIISNDLPDVNDPEVGGFVDDLKIKFRVKEILNKEEKKDGKEGSLAVANTFRLRDPLTGEPQSADYLPYHAIIEIDSADVDDITGTTYGLQTLKHEIAHAIGFNSATFAKKIMLIDKATFEQKPLLKKFSGTNRYGFEGPKALAAYRALGGNTDHSSVPLEDDEEGTPSHWHEWLFPDFTEMKKKTLFPSFYKDELMTASSPSRIRWYEDLLLPDAFLSELTLGAFQDLGFDVEPKRGENTKIYQGMWFGYPPFYQVFEPNPLFDIRY
jgi:5-keto 4-deoxyuronate isomerase